MFRTLRADEIELRVQIIKENGFSVLLFKNARVDMDILDETVGAMNWKREHSRDNSNCTISIYNKEIGQWISKEDTGTENFTGNEKSVASDSFKRSAVNWGIGRELYSSPFVWINNEGEVQKGSNGKLYINGSFTVKEIGYNEHRKINHLVIVDGKGKVRYELKATQSPQSNNKPQAKEQVKEPTKEPVKGNESLVCSGCGVNITGKVADYSTEKYGKALCMKCQKEVK